METPQQSSNARLAAILALIAVFIVLIVVIVSSLGGGGGSAKPAISSGAGSQKCAKGSKTPSGKVYVVRPSDCCLSEIARKVGVSVAALERLNPGLDPQTIHSGDTVKLR